VRVKVAIWLAMAVLLVALLAYRAKVHRQDSPVRFNAVAGEVGASNGPIAVRQPVEAPVSRVLRLRRDQVLATVNGHQITVGEAVPVDGTNQDVEISPGDLNFFLNRAVDRELIFEAAKKQGVFLDGSKNQQLADMQSMRHLREPGGIAKLNDAPAGRQLEALDAKAFMLQTAIMAARGASPDVTEGQVLDYYHQHQSEIGNLPADADARGHAWQELDYQIRTQLAAQTRTTYNSELAAYMQQIKSEANVVFDTSLQ
jgi:hypothetical protein